MSCTLKVAAPVMGVGAVLMALNQDAPMSLLLLAVLPVLVTAIVLILRRTGPLSASLQGRIDHVNRVVREQITGVRVVRAFVRDRHEELLAARGTYAGLYAAQFTEAPAV